GSAFNGSFTPVTWFSFAIVDPDARFHASINTCNGCHGPDTGTFFLQVTPRFPGNEATLSPFLTGVTVQDQFSGQIRRLADLARRRDDLTSLVCPTDGGTEPPPDATVPTRDATVPTRDATAAPRADAGAR
ncbi:MAG TPA: LamG domain-containing protein, partial [Polyangiaceae bacterium]